MRKAAASILGLIFFVSTAGAFETTGISRETMLAIARSHVTAARTELDQAIRQALQSKELLRRQTALFHAGLCTAESLEAFTNGFNAAVHAMQKTQAKLDAAEAELLSTARKPIAERRVD